MKKASLLLAIAILSANTVFSIGIDSFKLKDFKYRVAHYKSLGFTGNFRNSDSHSESKYYTYNNNNGNLNLTLLGSWLKSSDNYLGTTTFSINASPDYLNFNNHTVNKSYYSKFDFKNQNSVYSQNNFYLKKFYILLNDQFSESNNLLSANSLNSIGNIKREMNSTRIGVYNTLEIGIGKGRLELITDAASALFILKDFEKAGLLNKDLSENQIRAVAQNFTRLRNIRRFDSRMKNIFILEQLDSAMSANHILNQNGIEAFSIINDNWFYANSFQRFSGITYGANLTNHTNYFYSTYQTENKNLIILDTFTRNKNTALDFGLNIFFKNHKAKNLYWGRIWEMNLFAAQGISHNNYLSNIISIKENGKTKYPDFSLNAYYSKNYTPNTRTNLAMFGNIQSDLVIRSPKNKSMLNTFGIGFQTHYWFAPRIQANLNWSLRYATQLNFTNYNYFNSSNIFNTIGGGINYYFY